MIKKAFSLVGAEDTLRDHWYWQTNQVQITISVQICISGCVGIPVSIIPIPHSWALILKSKVKP